MLGRWVVVVPVKDAAAGKSRLSATLDDRARSELVRAMALDTIVAAASCPAVGRVVVVTADEVVAREAPDIGRAFRRVPQTTPATTPATAGSVGTVHVVPEPSHDRTRSGLDAAALAGAAAGRTQVPTAPIGVLLGDLPALRPDDLAAALRAADGHARALVADAAGTGTTLLTVGPGTALDPRFGPGSAAAHTALGHVLLDVPVGSTLRHDVDLPADLDGVRALGPGPQTTRLLDRLRAAGAGDAPVSDIPVPDPPVRAAGRPA